MFSPRLIQSNRMKIVKFVRFIDSALINKDPLYGFPISVGHYPRGSFWLRRCRNPDSWPLMRLLTEFSPGFGRERDREIDVVLDDRVLLDVLRNY